MNKTVFDFLSQLRHNNNREWFNEHKLHYLEARQEVVSFLEVLMSEMAIFDEKIAKIEAKKSLFRIYRDTRFSKDKSPYKTNFGASLGMKNGSQKAGYYLHIEPGKSFLAGGIYQPQPHVLREVRKEISAYGEEFLTLLKSPEFKKHFGNLDQESKLQKVPQGFEKDDKMADFLRLKNFIVIHHLKDEALLAPAAAHSIAQIFRAVKPLNDFLNTPLQ